MPGCCTECVRLAARLKVVERELTEARCTLEETTAYAGQQHDKVADLSKTIEFLTTARSPHEA
jgi:hypothetical protein